MKGIRNELLEKHLQSRDPGRRRRAECWRMLGGLLRVDGLFFSNFLARLLDRHVRTVISTGDLAPAIAKQYAHPAHKETGRWLRVDEADFVVQRAFALLRDPDFSLTTGGLRNVHGALYDGIYRCTEKIRDFDHDGAEWVLGWRRLFIPCEGATERINAAMLAEREARGGYDAMAPAEKIKHLARFLAGVWKIRPFRQRNTFTLAIFALKYFAKLGFSPDPAVFAEHAWYFRNALVRAAVDDPANGVRADSAPLERFLENLLCGGTHELDNLALRVPGPSGALADGPTAAEMEAAAGWSMRYNVRRVLMFVDGETTCEQMRKATKTQKTRDVTYRTFLPAIAAGFVERVKPEKGCKVSRYRLTAKGLAWRYGKGYPWHRLGSDGE